MGLPLLIKFYDRQKKVVYADIIPFSSYNDDIFWARDPQTQQAKMYKKTQIEIIKVKPYSSSHQDDIEAITDFLIRTKTSLEV